MNTTRKSKIKNLILQLKKIKNETSKLNNEVQKEYDKFSAKEQMSDKGTAQENSLYFLENTLNTLEGSIESLKELYPLQ